MIVRNKVNATWGVLLVTSLASILSSHYTLFFIPNSNYGDATNDAPVISGVAPRTKEKGEKLPHMTRGEAVTLTTADNSTSTSPFKQTRPHPHAGARDSSGSWGYVADVYATTKFVVARYHALQNTTFTHVSLASHEHFRDAQELDSACNAKPREGKERKAGWRVLTRKIEVDGPDPGPIQGSILKEVLGQYPKLENSTSSTRVPRILCGIYTYERRQQMATTVAETWGWKCDGFFAASTKTATTSFNAADLYNSTYPDALGSVDLPHLGPERYDNMWQKTRSILAYMHDHYLEDFDFFFLSGDDTYVIVENLRRTILNLGEAAWSYPLYLGHWVPYGSSGSYYCGGGPGYVLNRKSLEILVNNVFPTCRPDLEDSSEDRVLGQCLRTVMIVGNHSVDAANEQRFHGMDPHDTCTMKGESGFFGKLYRFWGELYGFRKGFNLTSSQSVSFHNLRTSRHLKRIHAILYKSCPKNTTLGEILL